MQKKSAPLSVFRTLLTWVAVLFFISHTSFGQTLGKNNVKSEAPALAAIQQDDDSDSDDEAEEEEDADDEDGSDDEDEADSDEDEMAGDPDNGEELFKTNCASCHKVEGESTGPGLKGVTDRVPSRDWIYDWVHNSTEMIDSGDDFANDIFEEYDETAMTHFPELSEDDIDDILAYVEQPQEEEEGAEEAGAETASTETGGGIPTDLVLGILAFVLLLLLVVLALVNKTLLHFAEEKGIEIQEKEKKPKRKPLWKQITDNQFIMVVFTIFVFLLGSYWVYYYLMQIGVDQGYEPVQPIHFSHRIHAGENDIDCQYCHATSRVSKTSGVPSTNTCMNCHQAIDEVDEETATDEHSKDFYDKEIGKLYDAAGWDPDQHKYTGETEPIKWVRIHNLPDFAYYNHSQHVEVAQVDCQKCHGEVEDMEVMHQNEKLTMGWCIECHEDTDVKLEDNKYYEKIHDQLSKKYGIDKLTEAQMGGKECGRCHY